MSRQISHLVKHRSFLSADVNVPNNLGSRASPIVNKCVKLSVIFTKYILYCDTRDMILVTAFISLIQRACCNCDPSAKVLVSVSILSQQSLSDIQANKRTNNEIVTEFPDDNTCTSTH
jgi:hypothetical protein